VLILVYTDLKTTGTVVHHTLGLLSFSLVYISKQEQYFALLWTATELTTPFVNTRWFLYVTKQSNTLLYTVNGLVMTLGFLVWRVAYIPLKGFSALYYFSDHISLLRPYMVPVNFCIPAITLLNVYWTYLMIRGIISVLIKSKKGEKREEKREDKREESEVGEGETVRPIAHFSVSTSEVRRRGA